MTEENKLQTTGDTQLAPIPDYMLEDAGKGGKENIGNDVRLPQLKLCQSGTPQRKLGNEKFIEGLQEMEIFNDLTGENYGKRVDIVIARILPHKNIEFKPGELGVVLDGDVPDSDPRAQWPEDASGQPLKDASGKRIKPAATKYVSYLVWIPSAASICVWSLSSTQIKMAKQLNSMLTTLPLMVNGTLMANPPTWARKITLTTTMKQDGQLSWAAYRINVGDCVDEATWKFCRDLDSAYAKLNVVITPDAEPAADEPETFDGNGGGTPDM